MTGSFLLSEVSENIGGGKKPQTGSPSASIASADGSFVPRARQMMPGDERNEL
jgi:hypothetical protein